MSIQYTTNQLINFPLHFAGVAAYPISGLSFVKEGALETPTYVVTAVDAPNNVLNIAVTFATEGLRHVFLSGVYVTSLDVVAQTNRSILTNLQDESLGSWQWDKLTGVLQLYKQNGDVLSSFNVVDTNLVTSREKIVV